MLGGRSWDDWIRQYSARHQHPINRFCHTLGIPLIALSIPIAGVAIFVDGLWPVPLGMFVAGWIFQFVGHAVEGKPPEFFHDWRFLLVGLRWWVAKLRGTGVLLAVVLLADCGPSPVMASYQGEELTESFMQADFTRYFHVHVPTRRELGPAAPLVLAFHGVGQNGSGLRSQSGLDQAADSTGFIVVYLEAAMGAWDVFDDMAFLGLDDLGYVREVIERVDRRFVIDHNRIVAVGLSNGGVFAQRVGCSLPHLVAGFVAVAATMPRRLADECHPGRPIGALYLAGTADPLFPVAGSSVLLSFDETMAAWASRNGCHGRRIRSAWPDIEDDGTTAYWSRYAECRADTRTGIDSIVGGGHTWPSAVIPGSGALGPTSRDVSANQEIARFLAALRRG